MNRRMLRRFLLLLAVLTLFCSGQAFAAKKNKWVKKNGYWYYYNSEGKKSKGLTVIGKKTYYFDDTGKQRVGWRKIGDTYYKFRQKGKTGAYMYTSIKQEGITLGKRGRAKLTTLKKKRKAKLLAGYALWADTFFKTSMTKKQKLNAILKQLKKFEYRADSPKIDRKVSWDISLAELAYAKYASGVKTTYECYQYAVAYAYLADAVGFTDVYLQGHPEHAWVEIGGVLYDPTYYFTRHTKAYLPMTEDMIDEYHKYAWRTFIG